MAKLKKAALIVVLILMTAVLWLSFERTASNAETAGFDTEESYSYEEEEAIPYGLITKLNLSIGCTNGEVWASVKNTFTLFPAIVTVYVELYRSDTYRESYKDMTLTASNYIYDLDQGNTISAVYQTNGKQSYWKARMHYIIDSGTWQEKVTDTFFYNADGTFAKV